MKNKYLQKLLKLKSKKNKIFYPLNSTNLRDKDVISGINVMLSKQLTMSNVTKKFEELFKKKMNFKNSLMVNSGSSANLLALQCLINPYRRKRLKRGDQVLIPAVCWSTSLWPIIQSGLKPVFVDIDKKTFNISLKDLAKKINKKTKALMLVHVLGNSTNMDELIKIAKKNKIIIIEDTCESLGSKYRNKNLGSFGDFSTFSFYYSHQISSVEGGMICCKSNEDAEIIKSLRSHGYSRVLKKRRKIEMLNKNIDGRFLFANSGFNLRPTDIQAGIGMSQFNSLNKFVKQRTKNRKKIIDSLTNDTRWKNQVNFLEENENVRASWFGIAMTINTNYGNKKNKIIKKINDSGVETRPIISGNFVKQPAVKKYNLVKKGTKFINAQYIHDWGLFIGLPIDDIPSKKLKKFNSIFFNSFDGI